jgi:hypothetical protein
LQMHMNFYMWMFYMVTFSILVSRFIQTHIVPRYHIQPNPEPRTPSHSHASCLYMNLASLHQLFLPPYLHTRTQKNGAHQQHLLPASHIHAASRHYDKPLMHKPSLPAHPGHRHPSWYRHQRDTVRAEAHKISSSLYVCSQSLSVI